MAPDSGSWNKKESDRYIVGLTRHFLSVPPGGVEDAVRAGLETVRGWARLDRIALVMSHPAVEMIRLEPSDDAGCVELLEQMLTLTEAGGDLAAAVDAGEAIMLGSSDDRPAGAGAEILAEAGVAAMAMLPVVDAGGRRLGVLAAAVDQGPYDWDRELVGRLMLLAEVYVSVVSQQQVAFERERTARRFDALAQLSRDIVCEFDDQGQLIFVSPSVEEVLGVGADELLGHGFIERVHPDDREFAASALILDPDLPYDYVVVRLRRNDGRYLWMEAHGSSFPGLAGPRRILGVLRDISQRYEHQAQLEEHLAIEREVTRLSREFVGLESASLADAFHNALEASAAIAGCDESYVVVTVPDLNAGEPEVHRWVRPGMQSRSLDLSAVEGGGHAWFRQQLGQGRPVVVRSLSDLPVEAVSERQMMEERGIESFLGLPLVEGRRTVGVVGFVAIGREVHWSDHQLTMLRLVAELFSAVFHRARSEAHVREREERFRVLTEQSPDPILEFSTTGQILFASQGFAGLVGDADDDWVGRRLIDFVSPVEIAHMISLRDQAVRGERIPPVVMQCTHKDGSRLHLEATMRSFQTARGELHGIGVIRDVTAKLESERTLEQQLNLERRIVQISRDFMTRDFVHFDDDVHRNAAFVADLSGADQCAIVSFGTRAGGGSEVFEWINDKLPDASPIVVQFGRDAYPAVAKVMARGERFYFERTSQLPNSAAEERQKFEQAGVKSFLAIPYMQGGELRGVFALASMQQEVAWSSKDMALLNLASDIIHSAVRRRHAARELESSQLQLLQSQKMEAVGTLAGGIAHDFNNQLAVMLGNARFVLEQAKEGGDQHEALLDLERAAEHCAQLTRSLLAFSRQTAQETRTIDVRDLLDDVAELVKPLLPSNIELGVEVAHGLSTVRADETQLQQVMVNLLVNARDAMPEGGQVWVRATHRHLAADRLARLEIERPDVIEISIEDTGVGMEESVRSRIFEPFFTTKALGEGTGLGLATVYGIVKQCGGDIEVESEPGQGSTFRVFLPLGLGAPVIEPLSPDRVDAPRRGFDTVLLVEDEPAVRRVVRRMLDSRAKRVIEACDGDEALELVRDRLDEIDLLVTDMVMPRMGGVALAEAIAEARPDLPTLFLSGYPDDAIDFDAESMGRRRFLQKPFTQRDLMDALEALLDSIGPGREPAGRDDGSSSPR